MESANITSMRNFSRNLSDSFSTVIHMDVITPVRSNTKVTLAIRVRCDVQNEILNSFSAIQLAKIINRNPFVKRLRFHFPQILLILR